MPHFDRGVELCKPGPQADVRRPQLKFPRCETRSAPPSEFDWIMPRAEDFNGISLPWFFLRFKFSLATPFASKDDRDPGSETNLVVREWVFQRPIIRPTTWKGRLKFAADEAETDEDDVNWLFGKPGDQGMEGRLHFFPTVFDSDARDDKQILNPHDRGTRHANRHLVNIGVVPAGAGGVFAVLYVGTSDADVARNAPLICGWLPPLLTQYGIGARTLKGDGLCSNRITELQVWPKSFEPGNDIKDIWDLKVKVPG